MLYSLVVIVMAGLIVWIFQCSAHAEVPAWCSYSAQPLLVLNYQRDLNCCLLRAFASIFWRVASGSRRRWSQ